jgi:hypothetical protein
METDAARYFNASELAALGEPIEPWTAWLIRRVFAGEFQIISRTASSPFAGSTAFI